MADGEGVFTNIDAFVKYLSEHGEVEASVIAADLGVTEKNVEEWAKILENSKMAKITYKLGRMYVSTIGAQASNPEVKQMTDVKKAIINSDIGSQLADVSRLAERIEEFNKSAAASQAVIDSRAGEIKDVLNKIAKFQAEANSSFNQIKAKKEEIEKFSQGLGEMLGSLSGTTAITGAEENRNKAKAIIEDLKVKTNAYEAEIAGLLKNYDSGVRDQRNRIIEFSKNARTEIQVLNDLVKEEERNLQRYESSYKNYTNESARISKVVEKNNADIVDSMGKAQAQIESIYQMAEEKKKKLEDILANANAGISGFTELSGRFAEIKAGIAEASKENDEIRKELELLTQQLKTADAMSRQKSDEKKELVEKVEKASAKTAEKVAKQKEKEKRLREKLDEVNR